MTAEHTGPDYTTRALLLEVEFLGSGFQDKLCAYKPVGPGGRAYLYSLAMSIVAVRNMLGIPLSFSMMKRSRWSMSFA